MRIERLRRGEALAGAGALALLVFVFALHWYGGRRPTSGWHALTDARWLVLLTILTTFALVFCQITRPAPAVPASLSVLVTVLGGLTAIWLIYRVLINHPPHEQIGAVLGLLSACLLAYGGFVSLRKEGIAERDQPREIPVVQLPGVRGDPGGRH